MKLKIGQQLEVVEVLTAGGYGSAGFTVGGHTIHFKEYSRGDGKTLTNGNSSLDKFYDEKYGCICLHMFAREVKPVGRLTVTKVK